MKLGIVLALVLCIFVAVFVSAQSFKGSSSRKKPFMMHFPDIFSVRFSVLNRDDGQHRFQGKAIVRNLRDGTHHIKLTSTTTINEKTKENIIKQKQKDYYFDSLKFAFREVVHMEDASPSSKILPTSPIEFHKLMDIIEKNNYVLPDDAPIFDVAINKLCPVHENVRVGFFFEHQHYVLCVQKEAKTQFTSISHVISDQFIVQVDDMSPIENEQQLVNASGNDQDYPLKPLSFTKEKLEKELLSSKSYSDPSKAYFFNSQHSCSLSWLRDEVACASLKLPKQLTNRTCIFLHGVGQWPSQAGPPVNDFPDYWGKVSSYTPQCTERWFIREETKYRGWNNPELQSSYCALSLFNNTGTTIKNKILFTHSMGTMILSAAIKNGVCSIDKDTVSWYDVMGPIHGSKAALFLKEICVRANTWTDPSIYKIIADEGGYCIGGNSTDVFPAYDTLAPNFPGVQDIVNYVAPYASGQMCGYSAYGLNSIYSIPLFLLSEVVGYDDPNDGMVTIPSCTIFPNTTFSNNAADLYYRVAGNHADGTCRDGDSWWGNARPCSFYTNKV